jgi:hypothetical protein
MLVFGCFIYNYNEWPAAPGTFLKEIAENFSG